MPNQWVRLNLANAIFPFQSQLQGRSIIIAGSDQNYNYIDEIGETVKDRGIPQAFYMHNVLPTAQGYQAIGYDSTVAGFTGSPQDFDTCFPLYQTSPTVARFLFSPGLGKNYVYDPNVGSWASVSPQTPGVVNQQTVVTTAFVNGVSYVCYAGVGIYTYTPGTTPVMSSCTTTGITVTNIQGICAAQGYMIVWDNNNNIYWSNTTNPLDFVPSLVTGAGGGSVQAANGQLKFVLPIAGGFIAYCERNAVAGSYSGNFNFPFVLREVAGSGGAYSPEDVSWQSNQSTHYAWTTAGLQQLSLSTAQDVFPEATEFLEKLIFEDFDEPTLTFTEAYLSQQLSTKIAFVSDRYLVMSYGIAPGVFTYALIYDLALGRWGKLKITHVKCFEWNAPVPFGSLTYGQLSNVVYSLLSTTTYGQLNTGIYSNELPDKNIAFMDGNGVVKLVNFDLAQTAADGVLIIGKIELTRNRGICHQQTDVSNLLQGNNFSVYVIPTQDGQTLGTPVKMSVAPYIIKQGPTTIKMGRRVKGQNISILFTGAFNLTTLQVSLTQGGSR
jgi:hypothetical protein